jgi:23S rRNA (adenine2503-C2)-methyltransferase
VSTQTPIHGLGRAAFEREAKARLLRGAGAAGKIWADAHHRFRFEPLDHVGARSAEAWREAFSFELPELAAVHESDGEYGVTRKAVLRLPAGLEYELVHIPMVRDRYTLCVSSQIGCKMGCRFCETAKMGFLRNLDVSEVMAQFIVARSLGWHYDNVVFMGMGEALDNFETLATVLGILTDPSGYAFGQERITVCTVGRPDGIAKLAALGMKRLNLAVSLNAVRDDLRVELMPVHRNGGLAELKRALAAYRPRPNFCLAVNYCLLPGINDTADDLRGLVDFCEGLARVMVHVIPYNPGTDPLTRAPEEDEIERFLHGLRAAGIPVRRRVTKGRDVMAACGQLGNVELRRPKRSLPVAESER